MIFLTLSRVRVMSWWKGIIRELPGTMRLHNEWLRFSIGSLSPWYSLWLNLLFSWWYINPGSGKQGDLCEVTIFGAQLLFSWAAFWSIVNAILKVWTSGLVRDHPNYYKERTKLYFILKLKKNTVKSVHIIHSLLYFIGMHMTYFLPCSHQSYF